MNNKSKYSGLLHSIRHFSIFPKDDWKQTLRLRRFFMALTMYIFCPFLAYIAYLANIMEWPPIYGYIIAAPIINVVLYIVFRTGLNLKMKDPSLTSVQICLGIIGVMYGMYFANEARGVLLLVYVIILLFGIYRLNTRGFLFISAFTLVTYGGDIALLYHYRPQGVNFKIEFLQWVVLTLVLIVFSIIGGQISSLRRNLSISKSQQAKSIEIIREMAIRDELTGLYNRRYLIELLDYEKNRSLRSGGIFCLALLDIDSFKNVNDRYGHLAGDEVLKTVATMINKNMRNTEFCGRYGGEEFLIVITQTDIKGALICAERVRTNIENLLFPDISTDLKITVSLGLSEYQLGEGLEEIISRADQSLYRAKKGGRNRIDFEILTAPPCTL